jgi:hypothetical protein
LITPRDKEFVGHIVKNLEAAHQEVPQEVLDLALQSSWYRKQRYKSKGGNPNVGGVGLGFKEKVGSAPKGFVSGEAPTQQSQQSRGPATDRLSAMKAAFKTQYMNQVRRGSRLEFDLIQRYFSSRRVLSPRNKRISPRRRGRRADGSEGLSLSMYSIRSNLLIL